MSLQSKYMKFAGAIALTRESEKYKEAREKDDLITPKIEKAFNEKGWEVDSSFIQGSLKSNTGVIPLDGDCDIDRAVAIKHSKSPENPVDPKKTIKKVLSDHGFSEPKIKKPCVTADYKGKDLHIDYPTYRVDDLENYQLAVGKEFSDEENRYWEDSDPKGLVDWVTSTDNLQGGLELTSAERSQFYRVVRYLKRWRDFKYSSEAERKKIYSIAVTIMAKGSFCPCVDENSRPDDHQALKDTLDVILEPGRYFTEQWDSKYDVVVDLPVVPNSDVFKGKGSSIATVLRNRLDKLRDILKDVDGLEVLKEKCELLRKHFGDDFPESDDDSDGERIKKKTPGFSGVSGGA